jgi:hypothetical protein
MERGLGSQSSEEVANLKRVAHVGSVEHKLASAGPLEPTCVAGQFSQERVGCGVDAVGTPVAGQASEIHGRQQATRFGGSILDLDGDSCLGQQPSGAQAGDASTNYEYGRLRLDTGHGASLMQTAGKRGHEEGI